MATIGRMLAGLACAGVLLTSPLSLRAEERIHVYEVDIAVAEDGNLEIAEHIHITAEGEQIVHGIDREIPLAFITADGHRARSHLTVLDIQRDGEPEHYEVFENNRGAVIRIGTSGVKLTPDDYLYSIQYQVNRIINHSAEHDRLIWNVNGNEGRFPIDSLSARVTLPEGAAPLGVYVHTGALTEHGKDAVISTFGNVITFETTRTFLPGQNMTFEILLPKGVIQPPDEATLADWKAGDYASTSSAAMTAGWSALLALFLWFVLGRDPRPGVIVPRWDPPNGMSPGRVHYSISRNFATGFWTAFSASIIDLAIKGKVVLEDLADGISVRRIFDADDSALPNEQAAILRMLPPSGDSFRFNGDHAARTLRLADEFCDAVATDIGHTFYKPKRWVWISFGLLMFFALLGHEMSFSIGVEYLDGWLPDHCLAALVAWVFAAYAVGKWRKLLFSSQRASTKDLIVVLLSLFVAAAILLLFTLLVYADAPVSRDGLWLTFSLAMLTTLLWAFIGRLSRKGREVMDGIDGLRLYLELAEKDRMALAGAPAISPAHYETLLPYAIALGVEKAWSNHFEAVLAEARSTDASGTYHPLWYSEPGTGALARAAELGEFSSRMAASIERSLPRESESDGTDSVGSSGSGRGGGGIGGW
ncbi:DUF2207 domain-containing protein [Pusillimonas sp. (ex Stolz et al. 2005)]|uniref:DUF2207 domain-containing protein n=1 Tax=Pusillimonas sp. (ex Stolz et al. 2005) TaxID=1979962 RepID=UPI002622F851|nr:DUF2207 domain-containing protein [Pusillimonas sp. (ex Stolz et al. 2005)]